MPDVTFMAFIGIEAFKIALEALFYSLCVSSAAMLFIARCFANKDLD